MEFKVFHKDFFKATTGAFSRVTQREHYDSQITLTDIEADIVVNHFGINNITLGNVNSDKRKSLKEFLLYPNYTPIHLNLVFPKPEKHELRLYIASGRGFKPKANEIWFIYETVNKQIVIGALDENFWGSLGQEDIIDDEYQSEIEKTLSQKKVINISPNGKIATTNRGSQIIYVRDPRLAIMRFTQINYSCEIDPSHKTFITEKTNLPFMEAHHFIPMKFQHLFKSPLDNFNNIISLCPNCHRGIHHAVIDYKYNLINIIYKKRPELQSYSLEYIAQFYNCLKVENQ